MNYNCFKVEIDNRIAHIQLDRPQQMNAMDQNFWHELPECVRAIDASGEVRVILVSANGKHFCSGMDVSVFQQPGTIPLDGEPARVAENLRRLVMQLQDSLSSIENVRLPVLMAIHGACIGGAVDMVCAADMRYCTKDAFFCIKETQIGMTADLGTLQRMPKLMSEGVVRELAYTGRDMFADEALRLGFVNQVFDDQNAMLEGVMAIARQIAQNSPLAVAGSKEMMNYSRDHGIEDSLKYMATWQAGMFRPADLMASFGAQASKTLPQYENLKAIKPPFK